MFYLRIHIQNARVTAGVVLSLFTLTYLHSQSSLFRETSVEMGLHAFGHNFGLAVADCNHDGLDDLYVSRRNGENLLFLNDGSNKFLEWGHQAGIEYGLGTRTSIWADLDNDGFPELYLGNDFEADILYKNNEDGTFVDVTGSAGILNPFNTFSVNVSDVNLDGRLDIYVSNFLGPNALFINRGELLFTDSAEKYMVLDPGKSMASIFFDYDNDGDQDLYMVHDGGEPNVLLENTLQAPFKDVSALSGSDHKGQGMGVDAGDINNDGWMDLYITNLYENTLLLNKGDGSFEDISQSAGVDDYGMGWGTTFLDFDNDGWVDIYLCNDSYFSSYPNVLYRNKGDLTFEKIDQNEVVSSSQAGYGCVCADLDLDGAVDIVVANEGDEDYVQIFHNQFKENHWIGFKLVGTKSNRDAVGAKIQIHDVKGVLHYDEITGGNGFAGQNSAIVHFGLGKENEIKEITVNWPSGTSQVFGPLNTDQYYVVVEDEEPREFSRLTTAITEQPTMSAVAVYPNPSMGVIFIDTGENPISEELFCELWSVDGHRLYAKYTINDKVGPVRLNIDLPDGLYWIRLTNADLHFTQKLAIFTP